MYSGCAGVGKSLPLRSVLLPESLSGSKPPCPFGAINGLSRVPSISQSEAPPLSEKLRSVLIINFLLF